MKKLRLSLAVTVLTLVFSIPAFAGDMETTVTSQRPAAITAGGMQTSIAGDMDTTVTATDALQEIALNLLQSLLSLF